jgi:hypothetical protein
MFKKLLGEVRVLGNFRVLPRRCYPDVSRRVPDDRYLGGLKTSCQKFLNWDLKAGPCVSLLCGFEGAQPCDAR